MALWRRQQHLQVTPKSINWVILYNSYRLEIFKHKLIIFIRRGDTIICIWLYIPQLVSGGGASIICAILTRWMSPNYYGPDQ